jgi:acetylornithine deacetylase
VSSGLQADARQRELERATTAYIAAHRDEIVALASDLIRLDTTARHGDAPARDEAALQLLLGDRLAAVGATVDIWEPDPDEVAGSRQVGRPLSFAGRPQLLATLGDGTGPSLLFNGHIDAVSYEPRERWSSDPLRPAVRDGRLYGRGACDMKGGVAAMVFAAEALARLDVPLAGALKLNTVTDEESSGAGGLASVAHGVRADAAIVPEPTGFDVWVACRGTLSPTVTVAGRPGHAEVTQPHWSSGGAVNAIEKALPLVDAMRRLRDDWRVRPDQQHPFVRPGDIVPTKIAAGEWHVSYPSSCRIDAEVTFPPGAADADGFGSAIRSEIEAAFAAAARTDPWLSENPPRVEWAEEYPAAEVPTDAAIVALAHQAAADVGRPGKLDGLDSWHDGATYTRAGVPAVCLGPGAIEVAHTIDEYVPVDDLVRTAQALALVAIRFCGIHE